MGTAAEMVAESDYQMMCRSLARPKQLGGRKTLASTPTASGSAPPLTVLLTPALQACNPESFSSGGLHIREYLEGVADADPTGMHVALAMKDHEISARQWRALPAGGFTAATRASMSSNA